MFHDNSDRKEAFQEHKNNKLKESKNWDFSKGVSPCFWSKIGNFPSFDFWQKTPGKCVLRYFERKNAPLVCKNRKFKKSKKCNFSSSFGQKLPIFPSFHFRQKMPEKCVLRYSRKKKRPSRL